MESESGSGRIDDRPPQSCFRCGRKLDSAEWCGSCAWRRQVILTNWLIGIVMLLGCGACSASMGHGVFPDKFWLTIQNVGSMMFIGGPILGTIYLAVLWIAWGVKIDREKRDRKVKNESR